ncbi:hypothetical protein ATE92_2496 [Ulvibacter sp. MAR_2010_11]|uniref:hypothetical protein n=1 Tax=Ulvibacter sp. MAR_2010_11 TaxID=1250229 RepID=UPI000C2CBE3E|nr:hypothetical protein [Ulvibacter sp. MAR_2010_11]PKA84314.1 hypothetical protein ATE92_2496 [Ulvibacter sp. MAR_2010_11]
MVRILILCLFIYFFTACNDGDVIVTTFDFDDANLQTCEGSSSYVFFKINSGGFESISLQITTSEEFFLESSTQEFALNTTSNIVNYRNYDAAVTASYFCSSIPPTSPTVTTDYIGTSGTAILITTTTLDDNDSIDEDPNNDLDTDGDLIPNYYDYDDDGDNVPTSLEIGSDLENPRDFDGDGIPDYLDPDDDNDGTLTRYEAGGGFDPITTVTDPEVGPDYLNPAITTSVIIDEYRTHTYSLSSDISLSLQGLVLINGEEEITQENIDLGTQQDVVSGTVTITPEFN